LSVTSKTSCCLGTRRSRYGLRRQSGAATALLGMGHDGERTGLRGGNASVLVPGKAACLLTPLPQSLPMNLQVANIALRCFRPRTSGRRAFATQRTDDALLRRWYAARTAQRAIPTLRTFHVQGFKARIPVRRTPSPLRGEGSQLHHRLCIQVVLARCAPAQCRAISALDAAIALLQLSAKIRVQYRS
jgi:hypothetical protein